MRIVLGVDGSHHSGIAVRAVAARKWPEGSEVRLVTSVDPLHMYGTEPEDKYTGVLSIHQSAKTLLCDAGLEVSSVAEEEDAKRLLVKEAEEWGADSIFVGARGLGRLGALTRLASARSQLKCFIQPSAAGGRNKILVRA